MCEGKEGAGEGVGGGGGGEGVKFLLPGRQQNWRISPELRNDDICMRL